MIRLSPPASYQVLGAVPLGEGVADKPTKRRESALLAGAIRGATWLGSEGKPFPSFPPKSKITILLILLSAV